MEEILETCQYLSFTLGGELFALDISKVREVLDYTKITKVPRMPDFILGVINLRGSVVPVVDMRLKFDMAKGDKTVNTCIVIVEVLLEGETIALGALVDAVQEVFDIEPSQIEPPPRIGTKLKTEFIKGMGKKDEQFVIILNIDRIFSMEELSLTGAVDNEVS
jgi:purine-binding chemotaxis protein CheW